MSAHDWRSNAPVPLPSCAHGYAVGMVPECLVCAKAEISALRVEVERLTIALEVYRAESVEHWRERARVAKEVTVAALDEARASLARATEQCDLRGMAITDLNARHGSEKLRRELAEAEVMRQRTAVGRAHGERDYALASLANALAECARLREEGAAKDAEIGRLRATLERIASHPLTCNPGRLAAATLCGPSPAPSPAPMVVCDGNPEPHEEERGVCVRPVAAPTPKEDTPRCEACGGDSRCACGEPACDNVCTICHGTGRSPSTGGGA